MSSRVAVDGDGHQVVHNEDGRRYRVVDIFEPKGRPPTLEEQRSTKGYMTTMQWRRYRQALDPFRVYDAGQHAHERWLERQAETAARAASSH